MEKEEFAYADEALYERAQQAVEQGLLLDLKSDVVFKSFFSKESEESKYCRCKMISAVIERQVVQAEVRNPEILPEYMIGKVPRLDIKCLLDDGSYVDVEIQQSKESDAQEKRAVYYASRLMSGTLERGHDYKEIPHVYQIMFTDFNLTNDNILHHRYTLKSDTGKHELTDSFQVHFIELPKLKPLLEQPPEELSECAFWAMLIATGNTPETQKLLHSFPDFQEALTVATTLLNTLSQDKKEWYRKLAYEEAEIETGARMAAATRIGLERGMQQGIEQGIQQGSRSAKLETARILKQSGVASDIIEKSTGLTAEEIEQL